MSIKGAFIFATMDLIAFCALKWSVRGPRMRSNISSVVEFKSKIFGQESTYMKGKKIKNSVDECQFVKNWARF